MASLKPAQPIKLYRAELSGHSHRVQLFLGLLGLPCTLIDVDLAHGAHKRPDFLAKNPLGQVPVIEDGAVCIYDSNAILVYLAKKYDDGHWLPDDAIAAARVQQWLSLAAGEIANGPAAARRANVFGAPIDHQKVEAAANQLLKMLDTELAHRNFAIGTSPTIADVAGYSYIAKAPEGGISLAPYPAVEAWLKRIEDLPGFVPFKETKVGLLASKAG